MTAIPGMATGQSAVLPSPGPAPGQRPGQTLSPPWLPVSEARCSYTRAHTCTHTYVFADFLQPHRGGRGVLGTVPPNLLSPVGQRAGGRPVAERNVFPAAGTRAIYVPEIKPVNPPCPHRPVLYLLPSARCWGRGSWARPLSAGFLHFPPALTLGAGRLRVLTGPTLLPLSVGWGPCQPCPRLRLPCGCSYTDAPWL